nr:MAG TPA: hypothetical protein [Caudoviricetes sp.]
MANMFFLQQKNTGLKNRSAPKDANEKSSETR